jgi:Fe-S-cluster containining protein
MNRSVSGSAKNQTATIDLVVNGRALRVQITAPKGLTRPSSLLPQFQSLADSFVAHAVKATEEEGLRISCKKGCGACCSQVVPISDIEAQSLRKLVSLMPEGRRNQIKARFVAARESLHKAGLLEKLLNPEKIREGEVNQLGLQYFAQGIACPFLEEGSCSIHPDRPISCREYLVTSPAENCARPQRDNIRCVNMPMKISKAIRRLGDPDGSPWLPLILALDHADSKRAQPPKYTGPELVQMLFARLTDAEKSHPTPDGQATAVTGTTAETRARPWWRFW